MDPAHRALELRPPRLPPSAAAVSAATHLSPLLGPVADEALMGDGRRCRLYRGAMGGVGSGYLHQELLAEAEDAGFRVVLHAPELVGVDDAHIEKPPHQRRPRTPPTSLHYMVGPQLVDQVDVALVEVVVHCNRRTEDCGPAAGGRDSSDPVNPEVWVLRKRTSLMSCHMRQPRCPR